MSLQTKIEQAWDNRELLQQEEYQNAVREVVKVRKNSCSRTSRRRMESK